MISCRMLRKTSAGWQFLERYSSDGLAVEEAPASGPGVYRVEAIATGGVLSELTVHPDGSLEQITSASIPYQSPQGLTGW